VTGDPPATERPPREGRNTAAWASVIVSLLAVAIGGLTLYLNNRPKPAPALGGMLSRPVAISARTPQGYSVEVRVKVTLYGLRNRQAKLRWTLDDADTGQPAAAPAFVQQDGPTLIAEADTDQANADFRLPPIGGVLRRWIVHLTLLAPNGSVLDETDTPAFVA
jgi:hypothetical protein